MCFLSCLIDPLPWNMAATHLIHHPNSSIPWCERQYTMEFKICMGNIRSEILPNNNNLLSSYLLRSFVPSKFPPFKILPHLLHESFIAKSSSIYILHGSDFLIIFLLRTLERHTEVENISFLKGSNSHERCVDNNYACTLCILTFCTAQ